jgi:hypothetical protein
VPRLVSENIIATRKPGFREDPSLLTKLLLDWAVVQNKPKTQFKLWLDENGI